MIQFSPDNPLIVKVGPLYTIDAVTGARVAMVSGTVTGFLSLTRDAAAAVAGGLTISLTYIGNQSGRVAGEWMLNFPATTMTKALLEPLFKGKRVFLIIVRAGARRVVEELQYVDQESATLV